MSPPRMNYTPTNSSSRRVEFSGLSTINSEAAPEESPAPHWDSETDHLLSYFLGDPNGGGQQHSSHRPASSTHAYQDFTSSVPHSSSGEMNPPLGMNASYGAGSSRTSSNSTLTETAEMPQPPRTPAMQFYHPGASSSSRSHSQQLPTTSYARQTAENIAAMQQQQQQQAQQGQLVSSSSSSSLSSMAAALVSGGPVLHHHIQHRRHGPAPPSSNNTRAGQQGLSDSPPGQGKDSPLSPAAMIGTGHENLMLPPASRRNGRHATHIPPSNSSTAGATSTPQVPPMGYGPVDPAHHHKEGHLAWLTQLNARAKAASHNPNQPADVDMANAHPSLPGVAGMPPSVVAQHSAAAMTTGVPGAPTAVYHAGTFPSAVAATAAVAQNPMLYQAALNHKFHMAAQSQGETEEKRARRLERNRESARKSRRRKKERLATLEGQVDRLHTQIEDERRLQVNAMCSTLGQVRMQEMAKLQRDLEENPDQWKSEIAQQRLMAVLRSTSGGSPIAQATVEFQYTTLKQVLLPRYQKFLLWLTLHNEAFFTAGKDEYTKKDGKQVLRVSSGRVSSKQIGDEVTNGWKTEKPGDKEKSEADTPDIGERSNPTSRSLDAPRMWPLLCFELSISVDQEERILQALKRLQQMENLANYREQLAAATRMTSSLTEGISTQCRIASAREDNSTLRVLTPAQSAKFHAWMSANHERCSRVIKQRRPAPERSDPVFKETSLVEFCRRLDEVLRISKRE